MCCLGMLSLLASQIGGVGSTKGLVSAVEERSVSVLMHIFTVYSVLLCIY